MKRTILTAITGLFCSLSFAQGGLEAGLAYGVPVGDARLVVASNFVIELGYLYDVTDQISIGGRAGYSIMIGEEVSFSDFTDSAPDQNYLTIAVSGIFEFSSRFWAGADVGWGFGANGFDQNDQIFGIPIDNVDGFYYSPRLRYHFTDRLAIEAAYRSILIEDYDASSVSAGVIFVLIN